MDDLHIAGSILADQCGHCGEIGVEHVLAQGLPALGRARHGGDRRDLGDPGGNPGVGGGHDLRAVAEIDLVAVVLRRVVARGHHDPGIGAQVADREGQHRRGQHMGQHGRASTGGDDDRRGVAREVGRAVPGVEAHDDEGTAPRPTQRVGEIATQVCREAGCRPDDHRAVHSVGTGPDRAAQPGGAELQHPGEAVGQVGRCGGLAVLDVGDDGGEFGLGDLVRVVGEPGSGGVQQGSGRGGGDRRDGSGRHTGAFSGSGRCG